jgi:uncharacterized membrane protein
MNNLIQFLRTTLVGGLLFLVPLIALAVVIEKAYVLSRGIMVPLADHLPFDSFIGLPTPIFGAIIVVILFCFLTGLFARTMVARIDMEWLEIEMLSKVPGYLLLKGMSESMLGVEQQGGSPVVLVRFDDSWQLGLEIERLECGLVAVYIPGAPNPQSGSMLLMDADRIVHTKLSLAALLKFSKSVGVGANMLLQCIDVSGMPNGGAGPQPDKFRKSD